MNIATQNITHKNTVKHSLNNIEESLTLLKSRLNTESSLLSYFTGECKLGNYHFDFYSAELKFAIQIDAYSYSYSDIYNVEKIKVMSIPHKNITVLKVSDYQVLVDCDEIIRFIKNHIKSISLKKGPQIYA